MLDLSQVTVRFLAVAAIEAACLLALEWLAPGIHLIAPTFRELLVAAASVAIVLALINSLIRPFLVLLTLPLNMATFGLSTLVINGGALLLASNVLPYFEVQGWGAALLGTLGLAAVNTLLTNLSTIEDDYAFFDGVVQWLGRRRGAPPGYDMQGRGLLLIEIDGLSYQRMARALEQGRMPVLQDLLREGSHTLSHVDCGLPSQSSACQAGIMYGDNYDIPAFRWYDKGQGRFVVSNDFQDAARINSRFSRGQGLLRGGTSINNLMAGDARKALLTMCMITEAPERVERYGSQDLYLLFLNPYFLPRVVILTLWDLFVELYQAARQQLRQVRPRVNRFHRAFPLVRALANVFLREVSSYLVILEVLRGSPAIYTTFLGYDEIAHHAGPDSPDALASLRGLDRQIGRILDVIRRKAPRPYDLMVLSDHGQSAGATFRQRYGQSLPALVEGLVATGTTVMGESTTDDSRGQIRAFLAEVGTLEAKRPVGRLRAATLRRTSRALQRRVQPPEPAPNMQAQVVVTVSGNLAHLYFNLSAGRVDVEEVTGSFPGLLEALVAHPGVGLVVTYEPDGDAVALGKNGARHLGNGRVTGTDPLLAYGDSELRACQLARMASFPHSGDLIVVSALYRGGEVAAFEELVGSHGGMGGQQTDAFLFHPADMTVGPTRNAADLFAPLDARRGLPAPSPAPRPAPVATSWSLPVWRAGLLDLRRWASLLVGALRLERRAYRTAADDPYTTGPALVTLLALHTLSSLLGTGGALIVSLSATGLERWLAGLLEWLLLVWLAMLAGRLLRGEGDFSRTVRALAFAQSPIMIGWLAAVPAVGPLFTIISAGMRLLASWMALQEALHLRRWAAVLVPVIGGLIAIALFMILTTFASGADLVLESLLSRFGISWPH